VEGTLRRRWLLLCLVLELPVADTKIIDRLLPGDSDEVAMLVPMAPGKYGIDRRSVRRPGGSSIFQPCRV
jgi:hypothetical protein